MEYALLIYDAESAWAQLSDEQSQAIMGEYSAYTQELRDRDVMRGGAPLRPTSTATTVRVRNGETLTTDGPFAETKEALGGFYLIEAGSLDEALEWAAKIPSARFGSIEVRPVAEMGGGA